jgi:hypothetical protein
MKRAVIPIVAGLFSVLGASLYSVMAAVNPTVPPDVFYVSNSTRKITQLIGDTDFERLIPTETRTQTRYGMTGSDLGVPFAHKGRTYVAFGDTQGGVSGDRDPLAWTTDTDLNDGVQLTFFTNGPIWRPITIPGISQGAFEVPLDGVSISNRMYLYHSTDHSEAVTMGRSALAVSLDDGQTFSLLYTLSTSHFINVSVNKVNVFDWPGAPAISGEAVFIFGSGSYRASDVRLAFHPAAAIQDVSALRYFAGLDGAGNPLWSSNEVDAIALFDQSCVGELSVAWNKFIRRWVMLYNCGSPRGINFRTAQYPWGPWSEPQVLLEPWDDRAYARFMHASWTFRNYDTVHNSGRQNDWGGEYGPYMFREHATGSDNRTTIYFTLSTWNPYVAVLMKSELSISNVPAITVAPTDQRVPEGESATFQLTASAVGSLAYQWQRNGTNVIGATNSTLVLPAVTVAADATVLRCIVSNASGTVTSRPVRLLVIAANAPPVPQILMPDPNSFYRGGDTITFHGTATDAEDGALPRAAFRWQVLFVHGNHTVPFLGTLSGVTNESFVVPRRGEQATNVFFRILLSVTDIAGREATVSRDILPVTSTLRLASEPSGLQLSLDGIMRVTPATIPSVAGLRRNLGAMTPATSGGRTIDWKRWSDNGALSHSITVPETNSTNTATYRTPTVLVPTNALWKYLVTSAAPNASWRSNTFNDTAWVLGPAQLGFGDGDEATIIGYGPDPNNKYTTTYFRHSFTVASPAVFGALLVRLLRDDGGVVYFNGTEVFRSNMGGGAPVYRTEALSSVPMADETTQFYVTNIQPALLHAGTNVVAVEIHQNGTNSSDLSFALELRGVEHDPRLATEHLLADIILRWPYPSSNYVLQAAPSPAGSWLALPHSVIVTNGSNVVTVPAGSDSQFYRLRKL